MGEFFFTRKLTQYNPFSENGKYGDSWVSVSLKRSRNITADDVPRLLGGEHL